MYVFIDGPVRLPKLEISFSPRRPTRARGVRGHTGERPPAGVLTWHMVLGAGNASGRVPGPLLGWVCPTGVALSARKIKT